MPFDAVRSQGDKTGPARGLPQSVGSASVVGGGGIWHATQRAGGGQSVAGQGRGRSGGQHRVPGERRIPGRGEGGVDGRV